MELPDYTKVGTFRHWGGGMSCGSYEFTLKYRQSELEIVGNIQDETA